MRESQITDTLLTAVGAAVAASSIPTMPVQYPGFTFDIPNDNRYVEVIQIRNNRSNEYWGNERTYQGLLRLLVHWNNDETGSIPVTEFVDSIAAQMPKGSRFGSVEIYDHPDAGSSVAEGGDIFYPLTFRYRDFSTG